jgi:hypothetical protein
MIRAENGSHWYSGYTSCKYCCYIDLKKISYVFQEPIQRSSSFSPQQPLSKYICRSERVLSNIWERELLYGLDDTGCKRAGKPYASPVIGQLPE